MIKINTDLPYYIGTYSITELINEVDAVKEDAEISWDSTGGSTWAGQKFIDHLNNRESKLTARVTGIAASMGAITLPFFDYVIGAEESEVMIHQAIGGDESTLKATNKFLYAALAKKINEDKFEQITGHKLKKVMLGDERIDVWMIGKDAKKIGLYDETFSLLDGKSASLISNINISELDYELPENIKEKYGLITKKAKQVKSNTNEMEMKDVKQAELKSGNPSVYNAIEKEAIETERKRVSCIMKYAKFDMEKAKEMIEKGATLGVDEVEHFMEKKFAKTEIDNLENSSEGDLNPGKKAALVTEKTAEVKEKESAISSLRDSLGTSDLLEETKK